MKKIFNGVEKTLVNWLVFMLIAISFRYVFIEPVLAFGVLAIAVIYTVFGTGQKVQIKYFSDIPEIKKVAVGDWIDLYASEDCFISKGNFKAIPLGVGMILPKGYEAIIAPRSSTLKQFHLTCGNSIGIIDNSYNGNDDQWHFLAYAVRDTQICKGDKICQFRIVRNQPPIKFLKVPYLRTVSRGGFGTTGRR